MVSLFVTLCENQALYKIEVKFMKSIIFMLLALFASSVLGQSAIEIPIEPDRPWFTYLTMLLIALVPISYMSFVRRKK